MRIVCGVPQHNSGWIRTVATHKGPQRPTNLAHNAPRNRPLSVLDTTNRPVCRFVQESTQQNRYWVSTAPRLSEPPISVNITVKITFW
jgi:hypothetical protein